jgi:CMP-N-acetylneuraminic acid synthetase
MTKELPHDPLVTVYVTNHNYGRYIRQAIESVLAQTFTDYELIIIDDGSTDDSRAIIREFDGNPRIRIILQENRGLNATNNIAIRAARGRYVMRLDADDFLDPNALLVMANMLEADDSLAMVFPDYYYVDAHGNVTGQERRHDFRKDVTLLDQPAHGACSMIRRECLLEVQAYSDSLRCQDGYELWLKIVDRYPVGNSNLPLFYYRRHGSNLTQNGELILHTRAEILKRHAQRAQRPALSVVAVVPVRGPAFDPYCLSLSQLRGRHVIDWTLDAALAARGVQEVLVTSPDVELLDAVRRRYGDRVTLHQREPRQALEYVPYDAAVHDAVARRRTVPEPDAILLLGIDFPLRSALYLDKAIDAMRVFDVDVVLGVIPENDLFYQHSGSGLRPVGNNAMASKMRFERDYLYRQAGGAVLVRKPFYDAHSGDLLSGRVGHIVLSREAGTPVRQAFDLQVAEIMARESQAAAHG